MMSLVLCVHPSFYIFFFFAQERHVAQKLHDNNTIRSFFQLTIPYLSTYLTLPDPTLFIYLHYPTLVFLFSSQMNLYLRNPSISYCVSKYHTKHPKLPIIPPPLRLIQVLGILRLEVLVLGCGSTGPWMCQIVSGNAARKVKDIFEKNESLQLIV